MKNKYWYLDPWFVLIVIGCIMALVALVQGNVWLFREFFKLDNYSAWDIIRAIIVAVCDVAIAIFLVKNASEIAAPDTYYDDDDLE